VAVQIFSIGAYIPSTVVTNESLAERVETSDEWIFSHTGIKERHIADASHATSDLAFHAAKDALKNAKLQASDIDILIVATATQDFPGFPSVACIVRGLLNADASTQSAGPQIEGSQIEGPQIEGASFDIAAGCTGFLYALEIARSMLNSGNGKHALVIGSETLSRILDWTDRNSCVLFGDGAGAVILKKVDAELLESSEKNSSVLHNAILRSDSSGAEKIIMRRGGSRNPVLQGEHFEKAPSLEIDGRAVYNFAVKAICDLIEELLLTHKLTINEISRIVPHQANARIIQAAAKRLNIPEEKFFMNMDKYANTSAASIPIALNDMQNEGLLCKGDKILLLAFGAGLTYAGSVVQW